MRITKEQLKQIIKEEIGMVMNEASPKDIDEVIKDLLGSTESADIEEIVDDLPQYGNDSDRQDIMDELEDLIEREEVEKFEDEDGDTMYRLAQNLEEQEQQADQKKADAATDTKEKFSKKLIELSRSVREMPGLDIGEMQIILEILVAMLKYSGSNSGKVILQQIKDFTDKKIGV